MGYYVEVPLHKDKAQQIVDLYQGEIVDREIAKGYIGNPTKAIIVVVNNGHFEAAGFAFNESEYKAFTLPPDRDPRPRKFVVMDRKKAKELTGYTGQ